MPYWNGIEPRRKTALALSGGGMFGAYQAGVWAALAPRFHPDIVVGVSAGALNAWAIAGGAPPEELAAAWLSPHPRGALYAQIQDLHARYTPRLQVGVVATELPRLRARLFENREIDWRVLAASAALPLFYRPVKILGRWYIDGGIVSPLPIWAAVRMGATRILAVNLIDPPPSAAAALAMRAFRALLPEPSERFPGVDLRILHPARRLGSLLDAAFWRLDAVERWLRLGERDAAALDLWPGA